MIEGAVLRYAIGGVILAAVGGFAWLQTAHLDVAQEREKTKDLVIARQAEELAREKRLTAARDATADELPDSSCC